MNAAVVAGILAAMAVMFALLTWRAENRRIRTVASFHRELDESLVGARAAAAQIDQFLLDDQARMAGYLSDLKVSLDRALEVRTSRMDPAPNALATRFYGPKKTINMSSGSEEIAREMRSSAAVYQAMLSWLQREAEVGSWRREILATIRASHARGITIEFRGSEADPEVEEDEPGRHDHWVAASYAARWPTRAIRSGWPRGLGAESSSTAGSVATC